MIKAFLLLAIRALAFLVVLGHRRESRQHVLLRVSHVSLHCRGLVVKAEAMLDLASVIRSPDDHIRRSGKLLFQQKLLDQRLKPAGDLTRVLVGLPIADQSFLVFNVVELVELASLVGLDGCKSLADFLGPLSRWLLLAALGFDHQRSLRAFAGLRGQHTLMGLCVGLCGTTGRIVVELDVLSRVVLARRMPE